LLVDDIYTTGATARACSQTLIEAGAASVRVATVARAQRRFPADIRDDRKYIRLSNLQDAEGEPNSFRNSSRTITVH
jgi:hypoxanthine-guanine phosphoribosyltransferase